ncbi:carbohydrate binding domain-containing protein [Paenibacillus sp. J5C2022]|uniref:carbohydrate binding domain-containing protein n=1 Tax=Paenibacillus sp. J5C2022 TaxID=2977129 RepID=UPI0021D12326|nr:carbohydrate binding domain-containing protein [Paenibacillus sp. J5C2022]
MSISIARSHSIYLKCISLLVTATLICSLMPMKGENRATASPANLIANHSFESGVNNPDPWSFLQVGTSGSWQWEDTSSHEGSKSIKLTLSATTDRAVMDQKYIPVTAGQSYRFINYAKAEAFTGQAFSVMYWYDASKTLIRTEQNIPWQEHLPLTGLGTDWSKHELIVTAPSNAAYAHVQLHTWRGTGDVWYDDIRLEPYTSADTIAPRSGTYNKALAESVPLRIWHTPVNNATIEAVQYDGALLQEGADYERSGRLISLSPSFMNALPAGQHELLLKLSSGGMLPYSLTVIEQVPPTANMTHNPGFEDGTAADPDGWDTSGEEYGYWSWDDDAFEGSRAVKLVLEDETGRLALSQQHPVTGGLAYQLSAQYRSHMINGAPSLRIQWLDAAGVLLSESKAEGLRTADEWSKLYHEQLAPSAAASAVISLQVEESTGEASFDGVVFQARNELDNPYFANGEASPYYWSLEASGAGQASTEFIGASRHIVLSSPDSSSEDRAALLTPVMSVQPEKMYAASFSVQSDGTAIPALSIFWLNEDGEAVGALREKGVPSSDWTSLSTVQFAPKGARYALLTVDFAQGAGQLRIRHAELRETLISGYKELIPVTDVEDIREELAPADFWTRFPTSQLDLDVPDTSVWSQDVLRNFFFGPSLNLEIEYPLSISETVASRDQSIPELDGLLGQPVGSGPPLAVAGDIPHRPFMKSHFYHSDRYYPRRPSDHLLKEYFPSYVMSGDESFKERAQEIIAFMDYSQWKEDGSNAFVEDFYPEEYTPRPEWAGGWDFLFDWRWTDASGYTWELHEPDHHVLSSAAMSLMYAYEMLEADENYLDMASTFFYRQIPRYGFHKGVWNNRAYYWTEYNPSGQAPDVPANDAIDNIQALVAAGIAMAAYYETDEQLKHQYLEFARGLLWFLVREYTYDGRFYYYGAEIPNNKDRAVSHDRAVLIPAYLAMVYMYKSGMDVSELLEGFSQVEEEYNEMWAFLQNRSWMKVFKLYDGTPAPNEALTFTTYAQITNDGLQDVRFRDTISAADFLVPAQLNVRMSKVLPPAAEQPYWSIDPEHDIVWTVSPEELQSGVSVPFELEKWDIVKISYELTAGEAFNRLEAQDTDSELFGWSIDGANRAAFIRSTSGSGGNKPHAQTMPLRLSLSLNADNFLSYSARLLFPLDDEIAVTLQPRPAPAAQPYTAPAADGPLHASQYIYPVQSLMPAYSTSGDAIVDDFYNDRGKLLQADAISDQATFRFPLPAPEQEYQVLANYSKAKNRGIVSLQIDGVQQGDVIDGYTTAVLPQWAQHDNVLGIDQGTRVLAPGSHTITYEITGKNSLSSGYYAGIYDALVLKPLASGGSAGIPGKPVLSHDNGYDNGIMDGRYHIGMNMWWGNNGTNYKLYENGKLIDAEWLHDGGLSAQSVNTSVYGRSNGTYRYYAELSNAYGVTASDELVVTVTDANPAKPVLSHDNWDGDGQFNMNMNMWWGTNGSVYRLYENGTLVDTQTLVSTSPHAQHAATAMANKAAGIYEYYCELINEAGITRSDTVIVRVEP